MLETLTVIVQEPDAGIVPPESATLPPLAAAVTVPPVHVVAPAGVAVLVRFTGYVSVNAAPVTGLAFAFVSVIVSTDVPPTPTAAGENAFAALGCDNTFNVPEPPVAAPALVVEMLPVLFRYEPAVALVTFTVTVHEPLAGTVAPDNAALVPLLAAVTVPPTHVVAPEADAVFTRPAGYVSVNAAPVIAVAFGLVSVIVITLTSFVPSDAGEKALATVRSVSTLKVALPAVVFEPALVVVSPPIGIVLANAPAADAVTFTVTVQEPEAGMVPPESATLPPLAAAVTVPPVHVVAPAGVAVFETFTGYISVNAAPVTAVAFAFVNVIVRTDVSPTPTGSARRPSRWSDASAP